MYENDIDNGVRQQLDPGLLEAMANLPAPVLPRAVRPGLEQDMANLPAHLQGLPVVIANNFPPEFERLLNNITDSRAVPSNVLEQRRPLQSVQEVPPVLLQVQLPQELLPAHQVLTGNQVYNRLRRLYTDIRGIRYFIRTGNLTPDELIEQETRLEERYNLVDAQLVRLTDYIRIILNSFGPYLIIAVQRRLEQIQDQINNLMQMGNLEREMRRLQVQVQLQELPQVLPPQVQPQPAQPPQVQPAQVQPVQVQRVLTEDEIEAELGRLDIDIYRIRFDIRNNLLRPDQIIEEQNRIEQIQDQINNLMEMRRNIHGDVIRRQQEDIERRNREPANVRNNADVDLQQQIEKLRDEISEIKTCQICTVNDKTRVINCGHAFCDECVTTLIGDRRPSCPMCRTPIDMNATRNLLLKKYTRYKTKYI